MRRTRPVSLYCRSNAIQLLLLNCRYSGQPFRSSMLMLQALEQSGELPVSHGRMLGMPLHSGDRGVPMDHSFDHAIGGVGHRGQPVA